MKRLALILLAACGGAPFTSEEALDAATSSSDSGSSGEDSRAEERHDSGSDTQADSLNADAGHLDSATFDSSPALDSAVADSCVPAAHFTCNGDSIDAPDFFCWYQSNNGTHGSAATPAQCRACGLYSCACFLQANAGFCNVKSCADTGSKLIVTCQ